MLFSALHYFTVSLTRSTLGAAQYNHSRLWLATGQLVVEYLAQGCFNSSCRKRILLLYMRLFGSYLSLVIMDTPKGSSKDPEGGKLGIRAWEGMEVLDRETLSGSLLGMVPCFPVAGALALRLAAACCDSIPATASHIWAGCQRVPSQSGHTQCQITPEEANSKPGRA